MSRFTVYNHIVTDEKYATINKDNIELMDDWIEKYDSYKALIDNKIN